MINSFVFRWLGDKNVYREENGALVSDRTQKASKSSLELYFL